jgi:sulfur carrier protein ThiS
MSVIVRPIGLLKSFCRDPLDDEGRLVLAGCEGLTIASVCRDLGLPEGMVSLFIVNGSSEPGSYRLKAGDQITCIAVIGGG